MALSTPPSAPLSLMATLCCNGIRNAFLRKQVPSGSEHQVLGSSNI